MPYALFSNEAKLSKAYPTEADVWKIAKKSGLVVDVVSEQEKPEPRPVLDQDYEIRPCPPEPQENPAETRRRPSATRRRNFSWLRKEESAVGLVNRVRGRTTSPCVS